MNAEEMARKWAIPGDRDEFVDDLAKVISGQFKSLLEERNDLKALLVYVVDKSPSVTLVWKDRLGAIDLSRVEIVKEAAGTDSYFTLKLDGHVANSCYGHVHDTCKKVLS